MPRGGPRPHRPPRPKVVAIPCSAWSRKTGKKCANLTTLPHGLCWQHITERKRVAYLNDA